MSLLEETAFALEECSAMMCQLKASKSLCLARSLEFSSWNSRWRGRGVRQEVGRGEDCGHTLSGCDRP